LKVVAGSSVKVPPATVNAGVPATKDNATVLPELVVTLPLIMPVAEARLDNVWLEPRAKVELKPVTSKVAPPATLMSELASEPLPLNASVPELTVVAPP
jgi:hypothetical protein